MGIWGVMDIETKQNSVTEDRMTAIFNEWNRRYSEDPDSFSASLGEDGEPLEDYGQRCYRYFNEIAEDMDSRGELPTPD